MILNILARIHVWYLWKIHFLNFRDIGALLEPFSGRTDFADHHKFDVLEFIFRLFWRVPISINYMSLLLSDISKLLAENP